MERPESVTDEHLEYLDDLRECGVTNMFAGGGYLQRDFGIERKEAGEILSYWMDSFGERHPN